MTKIGILSGGGKLPLIIGKSLIKQNFKVIFFCLKEHCNESDYKEYLHENISINSFTNILDKLKINNIEKIIMAGKVKRPSINAKRYRAFVSVYMIQ